jgi:hypothetical protein
VNSNPVHGEMYLIQHYVIKFVNDLRQVGGFLWVLWFPPPIKQRHYVIEILLKVALNTITLNLTQNVLCQIRYDILQCTELMDKCIDCWLDVVT